MKHLVFLLGLLFTILFSYLFIGCDSDTSTDPKITYPSIAKNWEGSEYNNYFYATINMDAALYQTQDSVLKGGITHYMELAVVRDSVSGRITFDGKITLTTLNYTVIAGTVTSWFNNHFSGNLKSRW